MSRLASSCAIVAASCLLALNAHATAPGIDDMCSAPKMKTDSKWQQRTEVDGMTLLIPPGFNAQGRSASSDIQDSHFYVSGEHRTIAVGSGSGVAWMRYRDVSETSECETVIAGRRALITVYHWVVEDEHLSASGDAGAHFAAVARFYPTGARREVYVAFASNSPSDLKFYRQFFWTISFDGAPAQTTAAQPTATLASATPAATTPSPALAAPAPAQPCVASPQPALPAASAVLDSAVVQSLIATGAPIPSGFEIMALQFDASGELAGMSMAQSDLPESAQQELAAVVGTNLKPHDKHAPATFLLRIDSAGAGLRYTILPAPACAK
jgi:hypothetical protein